MKSDLAPGPTPPTPGPARVTPGAGRKRLGAALVVLVLAGGAAWWWTRKPPQPEPAVPPLPAEISDPEVKQAVETARAKVFAAPRSADDWGHYAMVLLVHTFWSEADECLVQAGKLNPSDARWLYGRAFLAAKQGTPNAPDYFRQTIALGDSEYRSPARFGLAEYLLENGQPEAAAELFRQEFGPEPGHPRAALGLGQIALANGDDATATRLLTTARGSPYGRKSAAAALASIARRRGDEAAARGFEAESKEAEPRAWPDPFVSQMLPLGVGVPGRKRRIDSLERQGRYAAAHEEYLRLLAIDRSPKTLARAATNLAQLGNYREAIGFAREARDRDPDDASVQYTFALVLYTGFEKDWAERPGFTGADDVCRNVVTASRRAVELKPDHARAHLLWGLALKHLGDLTGARDQMRTGLSFRPDDVELLVRLGQVLVATGDKSGAITAFEEAKKLKPNDLRAANELEKLRRQ